MAEQRGGRWREAWRIPGFRLELLSSALLVVVMIWLEMSLRWGLPRFRYDHVMDLCWKGILPLSIANIFVTGALLLLLGDAS